jgi:integrase
MASLSPTTLTTDEQRLILRATAGNVRDHTIISLALGTGLRLAEIVGLDVGDVFTPDGLVAKLKRFWRAEFDRVYGFHALRHTAVTNVYRAAKDLFPAQRFARHVSPLTTTVYTHPSDQEMAGRVRGLEC